MKRIRVLLISILMMISVTALYAGTIGYVYGNNISSVDFTVLPRVGQVFSDGSNVLAVRRSASDAVVFDKLISNSDYRIGSNLVQRHLLNSIGVSASLENVSLSYSISTSLYPVYALALVGFSYENGFFALAGAKVIIPVARLWDSRNTFIENGKLTGWGTCGVNLKDKIEFASCYGFSYRHNLGHFHWEVGVSLMSVLSTGTKLIPYLGVGADI